VYLPGHVGIGLLLSAPVVRRLVAADEPTAALAVAGVLVAASVAPDADEYLPLPHRGPTHTAWFALALGGAAAAAPVAGVAPGRAPLLAGAAVVGVAGHLAGDAVTPMGIAPLAPLSARRVTLDLTPSAASRPNRLLLLAGVLAAAAAAAPYAA